MKSILLILLAAICLSFNVSTFACGDGSCNFTPCGTDDCANENNYVGDDDSMCSQCNCTDQGYRWNTCMTKAKYCYAFGNIGER
jgi:hypothetical protein